VGIDGLLWGMPSLPSPNVLMASLSGRQRLALGVYDPKRTFAEADYVAIEHIFVSWLDDNGPLIKETSEYARQRNRWLMITVEPWSSRQPGGGDALLLNDVASGRYDQHIDAVCRNIAALETPLFIRWGHEMEVPTGRYPWAQPDGQSFVDAYRRFVDRCRTQTDRAFYVWSPRGDHELDQYFPGKSYADYVGVSVYSFPDWEVGEYGRVRAVAKNFAERYDRIRKYDKPVMIAELGVTGGTLYQRTEITRAFADLQSFPLLQAVVYFNAVDSPGAWEARYGVPDWSIDPRYLTVGRR
jgi:cellulose synthase (UDP-forming)